MFNKKKSKQTKVFNDNEVMDDSASSTKKLSKRKNKKDKSDSVDPNRVKIKYKHPADERYFRTMPVLLIIGLMFIGGGSGLMIQTDNAYNARIAEQAMTSGTTMATWGRQTSAVLSLGNMIVSEDGKTLAVEVVYDDNAKRLLSTVGTQYQLRLVTSKDNNISSYKMTYGKFGTDKSGILTIHSDTGFKNKSFAFMLLDKSGLVDAVDSSSSSSSSSSSTANADMPNTTDGNTTTTSSVDQTISDQLANGDSTNRHSSSQKTSERNNLPPIFYAIVNPHSIRKTNTNWTPNSREMLRQLLTVNSIKNAKNTLATYNAQYAVINKAISASKQRLNINPNDTIATQNLQDAQTKKTALDQNVAQQKEILSGYENAKLNPSVLNPLQTKYQYFATGLDGLK